MSPHQTGGAAKTGYSGSQNGPALETEDTTNGSQEPHHPPYLAAVLAVHGVASERASDAPRQ